MTIPILDLAPEVAQLRKELEAAIGRVLDSQRFILGADVESFEREFASTVGAQHAVGLNSGTDALVIGLRALGVGPGDEVLVPSFTFFATAEAVGQVGAQPVFVDIDPATFCMDAAHAAGCVTPRTKAMVPVHLFGQAADMDALGDVASRHGLKVLEDVAQAYGARWRGRPVGSFGDAAAFSFFPSKNLGAYGDGGLLSTNDAQVARTTRMLRSHGSEVKYRNELLGYNSRLDAMQAAILRVKLPHVPEWNRRRLAAAQRYERLLANLPVVLPRPVAGSDHVYHQYTVRVPAAKRAAVQAHLKTGGIETMVYYPTPCHRLPLYVERLDLPHTDAAAAEVLSLPMGPWITPEQQALVARSLGEALA